MLKNTMIFLVLSHEMGPRGFVWAHIESIQRQNRIRKRLQPLPTPKTLLKSSKIKKMEIGKLFFPLYPDITPDQPREGRLCYTHALLKYSVGVLRALFKS